MGCEKEAVEEIILKIRAEKNIKKDVDKGK